MYVCMGHPQIPHPSFEPHINLDLLQSTEVLYAIQFYRSALCYTILPVNIYQIPVSYYRVNIFLIELNRSIGCLISQSINHSLIIHISSLTRLSSSVITLSQIKTKLNNL
uniref:Uncharacterized protein n=1 Tax=Wuchereria bancrofti TaxID=6293 RepID=A0AAF5PMY0_WUCBA